MVASSDVLNDIAIFDKYHADRLSVDQLEVSTFVIYSVNIAIGKTKWMWLLAWIEFEQRKQLKGYSFLIWYLPHSFQA